MKDAFWDYGDANEIPASELGTDIETEDVESRDEGYLGDMDHQWLTEVEDEGPDQEYNRWDEAYLTPSVEATPEQGANLPRPCSGPDQGGSLKRGRDEVIPSSSGDEVLQPILKPPKRARTFLIIPDDADHVMSSD